MFSFIAPIAVLTGITGVLDPAFWKQLYDGRLGTTGEPNIFIIVVVRLIVIAVILLAARIVVGVLRRLVYRAVSAVSHRAGNEQRRLSTLYGILSSALAYLVYFTAFLLMLFTMGFTPKGLAPLLGAASVLGLAVGFGAQRLVRDVITGLFILAEGQFDVGDWVSIGGVTGCVEDIGLRITRLRDDQGRMYVIANGDITQVFNASRGRVKLTVDIAVSPTSALEKALELIQRAGEETLASNGIPVEPACDSLSVVVVGMEAAKVTVRLTTWVPVLEKERIEDDLRRRLLGILEETEIALA